MPFRNPQVSGMPREPPPDPAPPIIPGEDVESYGNPPEPDEATNAAPPTELPRP
jgi:hypothetical protein